MSDQRIIKWTCDRCGDIRELQGGSEQPTGWASVHLHLPPRHADPADSFDLCADCLRSLKRAMEPPLMAEVTQ